MAARTRKHNESYEKYRKNLKKEDLALRIRLRGKAAHFSISFVKDKIQGLVRRTATFKAGRNQIKRDRKLARPYARGG